MASDMGVGPRQLTLARPNPGAGGCRAGDDGGLEGMVDGQEGSWVVVSRRRGASAAFACSLHFPGADGAKESWQGWGWRGLGVLRIGRYVSFSAAK